MAAMIVLVNLKDGVSPEEYERWVVESYAPAARSLPSVEDWRGYRVESTLDPDTALPCQYVVTLDVNDLGQLQRDMAGERMQRLFSELHRFADVTQMIAGRFA